MFTLDQAYIKISGLILSFVVVIITLEATETKIDYEQKVKPVLFIVQNDKKIRKKIKENLLSKCLFALNMRTIGSFRYLKHFG